MSQHRLRPELFDAWRHKRMLGVVRTGGIASVLGLGIYDVFSLSAGMATVSDLVVPTAGAVTCVGLIFGVVLFRAQGQWRKEWDAYELELTDASARRVALGVAPLEVSRSEVVRIGELADRTLLLRTADASRFVSVPPNVEGYDDLRARLATWHPIEREKTFNPRSLAVSLLLLGLWISTGVVPDVRIALALGALLIALVVVVMRWLWKQPNATEVQKKSLRRVAVLIALAPIARLGLFAMQRFFSEHG